MVKTYLTYRGGKFLEKRCFLSGSREHESSVYPDGKFTNERVAYSEKPCPLFSAGRHSVYGTLLKIDVIKALPSQPTEDWYSTNNFYNESPAKHLH